MELRRLGKYEIRGTLGKGAMGTVYDGYDGVIDRRVAIKTMNLPDPGDGEAQEELQRFRREAQAAGRLTHPNIVAVFDYGEDGPTAFIVMEYAPGTELKKILDKGDRLPPAEALRIMDGVLAGLQYSHERGVVHRDIKPGNIILSPDGTVKIADFGIARIESSSMTQAGTVMGTPAYMSPEQFMGQTVNARTDLYSAGVMLYQLLTGERPFEGSMSAIMHKALNTLPPRPSDLSVTAPPALDAVVLRAMAKRPEDRFESAAAFALAIKAAMANGGFMLDPLAGDDATLIQAPGPVKPALPRSAPGPGPADVKKLEPATKSASKLPLFAGLGVAVLLLAGVGGYVTFGTGGKVDGNAAKPPAEPPASAPANTPATPSAATVNPFASLPTVAPTTPARPPVVADVSPPAASPPATPPPATSPPAAPPPIAVAPALPPLPPAAPVVAPTPPPAPVTPPANTQVAIVQPSPAAIRDAIATSLRTAACSLTRTSLQGRNVVVSGLASRAAEPQLQRIARAALPANASVDSYTMRVDLFEGPYCEVLDAIRPVATPPLGLGLRNGAKSLRKDDDIVPSVVMPDTPSYLQVDYFSSDGGLSHLHPTATTPARQEAARSTVLFGNTAKERWQVDAPFGTDMIVAIASSQPLFAEDRPADETSAAYLGALRDAIEAATRNGVSVTANAIAIQTTAK